MRPIDESCDKSLLSNWLYFTVNPKLISAIWLDDYIIKTNYWMSFSIFRNFFLTWSCRIRSLRVLFRIRLKSQNTSKPSFTNNYLISQKVILESRFTRYFETSMSKKLVVIEPQINFNQSDAVHVKMRLYLHVQYIKEHPNHTSVQILIQVKITALTR